MVGKIEKQPQLNLFKIQLTQFIAKEHELRVLADKIEWDSIEKDFSKYYKNFGRPSVPIRKMVGLILLKYIYNLSDEAVVERWKENPYWQYFCGEIYFQTQQPIEPSEFVHFRNRIGEKGIERLLKLSIDLFGKEAEEKEVLIDTTVQEKNITYPTDAKLQKRIIDKCNKIASKEDIKLRQSYTRTLKQLMIEQRFRNHPKRRKKARASARKIKTIAGRIVRDLERKMNEEQLSHYQNEIAIFKKVLLQEKKSKNKIYSLHEPEVRCIAKGKEAKPYEFGNKTSIVKTKTSGIIVGALAFKKNLYDGDTLEPQLKQVNRLTGSDPKYGIVDRGYRGRKQILYTQIISPKKLPASASKYKKQKARERFRARAGIEPVIGHIKQDHRMLRNYLSGTQGDAINTMLAATAFNMKKMLNRIKKEVINIFCYFFQKIFIVQNFIFLSLIKKGDFLRDD